MNEDKITKYKFKKNMKVQCSMFKLMFYYVLVLGHIHTTHTFKF